MANTVQIELQVDAQGAVSGTRTFDTAVKSTTGSVKQLGVEMQATGAKSLSTAQQLAQASATQREAAHALGRAYTEMGSQASAGSQVAIDTLVKQMGAAEAARAAVLELKEAQRGLGAEFTGGESSLRTMNAELRSLQGSIFGDTRAAGEFLNILPGVGAAMGMAFPIFGAVAVVGVLVQAIEKAHELYENWINLAQVMETVTGITNQFGSATESAMQRAQSATAQYIEMTQGAAAADKYRLNQLANHAIDLSRTYQSKEFRGLPDSVKGSFESITGEKLLPSQLPGKIAAVRAELQKIQADSAKANEARNSPVIASPVAGMIGGGGGAVMASLGANNEFRRQRLQREQAAKLGQSLLGELEAEQADFQAHSKMYGAKIVKDDKPKKTRGHSEAEQAREIQRIHEQALESGLQGEALYKQKMEAELDELAARGIATAKVVADVKERYDNEALARLHAQQAQTAKMGRDASLLGLTGLAKTQREGSNRIADLNADHNLDPKDRAERIGYAQQETQSQMLQQERSFTQEVD